MKYPLREFGTDERGYSITGWPKRDECECGAAHPRRGREDDPMTDMNVPGQRPLPRKCANLSCPNKPGEGEFVTLMYEVPRDLAEDHHGHRPVEVLVCSPCARVMIYPVALFGDVTLLGSPT